MTHGVMQVNRCPDCISSQLFILLSVAWLALYQMNGPQRTACFAKEMHSYSLFTLKLYPEVQPEVQPEIIPEKQPEVVREFVLEVRT